MRRFVPLAILAMALMLVTLPAEAHSAPAAWQTVNVTLHADPPGGTVSVSAELPDSTALPAEVELSIPATASVQWVGEVLGGDLSADPQVKYTSTVTGGSAVYRFTLQKSRKAQIEYAASGLQTFDGARYATSFGWTVREDVPEFGLGVQLPSSARITAEATGALSQVHPSGIYYGKSLKNVRAGDEVGLAFQHELGAASGPLAGSSSAGGDTSYTLAVVLAVMAAVGAFLVIAGRVRSAGRQGSPGSPDVNGDAESVDEEAPAPGSQAGDEPTARRRVPALVRAGVLLGLVAVVAWGATAITKTASKPRLDDGVAVKVYSTKAPCTTSVIAIELEQGADPAAVAQTLFDALGNVPGMAKATFDAKTASLDVGYCESGASEASIRQALAPTGLLAD